MKRFLTVTLILGMMLAAVSCGNGSLDTTTSATGDTTTTETSTTETTSENNAAPAVNEGAYQPGVYTATSSYATEGMAMTWNFVLTLKADGTFTLKNDAGEDKGEGSYALTDTCYTLTYSDGRTGKFVVQKDGTLKVIEDFPFGKAQIQLALVGDIVFSYESEVPGEGTASTETTSKEENPREGYALNAGTYTATYARKAMQSTIYYEYTAEIGADGTFSYAVSFEMGGSKMEGSSASGTYVLDGNTFIFTDSENQVVEGELIADDALVIALKASDMASAPYEITLSPAKHSFLTGIYTGSYEKVSQMAGTVVYSYTAIVGEDGTFSYSVKFSMNGNEMDGVAAKGTYTLEGNAFTFTDEEGNIALGNVIADNTLVISLKASQMAATPYDVTFTLSFD